MPHSIQQEPALQPLDEYNQSLMSHVHPPDWVNPQPADGYDLVVIGAGTAGLVVAAGAAGLGLGLKIALIERSLMGGLPECGVRTFQMHDSLLTGGC